MLAVSVTLPDDNLTSRRSIVLVHGAANSAPVWMFWQRELASQGWGSYAIELRGHGRSDPIDLSRTTMHDYAADVRSLAIQLAEKPVIMGWSMGGLVAMMVAATNHAAACVALAPSLPVRHVNASAVIRAGEFGAEEYGITSHDPTEQSEMSDLDREERIIALASLGQESRWARDQRKAGIVIESLPCPLLVVTGSADNDWPDEHYDGLWLAAERLKVEGASHWGLVLNRRALPTLTPAVLRWLDAAIRV